MIIQRHEIIEGSFKNLPIPLLRWGYCRFYGLSRSWASVCGSHFRVALNCTRARTHLSSVYQPNLQVCISFPTADATSIVPTIGRYRSPLNRRQERLGDNYEASCGACRPNSTDPLQSTAHDVCTHEGSKKARKRRGRLEERRVQLIGNVFTVVRGFWYLQPKRRHSQWPSPNLIKRFLHCRHVLPLLWTTHVVKMQCNCTRLNEEKRTRRRTEIRDGEFQSCLFLSSFLSPLCLHLTNFFRRLSLLARADAHRCFSITFLSPLCPRSDIIGHWIAIDPPGRPRV